jgi:hypothetical protein
LNACLACEAPLPSFQAFCSSTCDGLYYVTSTDECRTCQETYRHDGYTKTGLPVMACPTCGERFECAPAGVA